MRDRGDVTPISGRRWAFELVYPKLPAFEVLGQSE